jgi:hypothetical protein
MTTLPQASAGTLRERPATPRDAVKARDANLYMAAILE